MLGNYDAQATLAVRDVDEAKKFYEETLGLEKVSEEPGGITYKAGNTKIFVYPSQYAGTNKATAVVWIVGNVDEAVEELKGRGVTFEQYDDLPETTREGDIHVSAGFRGAWFKDPSGNIHGMGNEL